MQSDALSSPSGGVHVYADTRIPVLYAATAAEYMHCPQISQAVDTRGASAPSRTTDASDGSQVFQFGVSTEKYIILESQTYHMATRGGFTFLFSVKFNVDPASSDYMVILALRLASGKAVQFYTDTYNGGRLTANVCGENCATVRAASAIAGGVWAAVGFRYDRSRSRLEVWVDGEVVSWADTLYYKSTVRS